MSIRFAILVVLNPRVDLNTLARVDFNPNILRLNLFNNLQEYFFKLVSNFVYRDSLSESEKKDMEILQIKKISDSVDMRIYDALNTLKTLEPNLKKLSNLTLFIILSIYYKYMDNKIYYLKPANMPEFSMREMEISVDPLIFLSNDIIREDIIYKNMEMMRRNEDKIHIHEKIITREMFKYLYESIITYEEENKLFSNEDISSSGIKYKLFK
jgi:hypothetical protein